MACSLYQNQSIGSSVWQCCAGEVCLTVRQANSPTDSAMAAPGPSGRAPATALPHLSRASSFQRSFRRSSSFTADAQVTCHVTIAFL